MTSSSHKLQLANDTWQKVSLKKTFSEKIFNKITFSLMQLNCHANTCNKRLWDKTQGPNPKLYSARLFCSVYCTYVLLACEEWHVLHMVLTIWSPQLYCTRKCSTVDLGKIYALHGQRFWTASFYTDIPNYGKQLPLHITMIPPVSLMCYQEVAHKCPVCVVALLWPLHTCSLKWIPSFKAYYMEAGQLKLIQKNSAVGGLSAM